MAAAHKALDDCKVKYTENGGMMALREAICDYLRDEKGVQYTPAQARPTMSRGEGFLADQIGRYTIGRVLKWSQAVAPSNNDGTVWSWRRGGGACALLGLLHTGQSRTEQPILRARGRCGVLAFCRSQFCAERSPSSSRPRLRKASCCSRATWRLHSRQPPGSSYCAILATRLAPSIRLNCLKSSQRYL